MSHKDDTFDVKIKVQDIRRQLQNVLSDHPHKDLIARKIIHNLKATERGLEHLFLAFSGVEVTTDFKVGERVFVRWSDVSTYSLDKEKMKEAGMIHQIAANKHEYIAGTIMKIDLRKRYCINVEYTGLDSSGDEKKNTSDLQETSVHVKDPGFFGKLPDEKPKSDDEKDDLPF